MVTAGSGTARGRWSVAGVGTPTPDLAQKDRAPRLPYVEAGRFAFPGFPRHSRRSGETDRAASAAPAGPRGPACLKTRVLGSREMVRERRGRAGRPAPASPRDRDSRRWGAARQEGPLLSLAIRKRFRSSARESASMVRTRPGVRLPAEACGRHTAVAQLAEHRSPKPGGGGSTPSRRAGRKQVPSAKCQVPSAGIEDD